jgi:hypothetical protein
LPVATTQATQPSPQNEKKVKNHYMSVNNSISTKYEKNSYVNKVSFITGVIDTGESVVINFNFQISP